MVVDTTVDIIIIAVVPARVHIVVVQVAVLVHVLEVVEQGAQKKIFMEQKLVRVNLRKQWKSKVVYLGTGTDLVQECPRPQNKIGEKHAKFRFFNQIFIKRK